METDYSMYRFFKGEKENPFDGKNPSASMFWFYESWFDHFFYHCFERPGLHIYAFYEEKGYKFTKLLKVKNYKNPSNKKRVFDMWLNEYLFIAKLYPAYGGENRYKKAYYSISVQ